MSRTTWKRSEREIAKALGGRRVPVTGIDRHGADVVTDLFSVQVKTGRNRPAYLREWLDGIRGTAQEAGRTGVVIWAANREPLRKAIVLMQLSDFVDYFGAVPMVEDASDE